MDEVDEGLVEQKETTRLKGLSVKWLPIRGGNRNNAGNAGLAALNLNNARSNSNSNIGFRPRSQFMSGQKLRRLRLPIQRQTERTPDPRQEAER